MHINMKKKSLFRRVSGVLTGLFFSTSLILAANENGQLFGSETLIVVVALLLFFVPLFLYVRNTTVQRNYPIGSVDLNRNHSSDVLV